MTEAGIVWDCAYYTPGQTARGRVVVRDAAHGAPRSVRWSVAHNGTHVAHGASPDIQVPVSVGVYDAAVTVEDSVGSTVSAGSRFYVDENTGVRAAVNPGKISGSMLLVGRLYSLIRSAPATTGAYPRLVQSTTEDIFLLPGTTHVTLELDPASPYVVDEVVARTKYGNVALRGFPYGLSSQDVGYSYRPAGEALPAPADLRLALVLDLFRVHAAEAAPSTYRVRINCWRNVDTIYRYEPCPFSIHPGGYGGRQHRWAILFTRLDVETDILGGNRLGASSALTSYATPETTSIPATALRADGAPDVVNENTGMAFTEANRYAIYESETADELDAKGVAALGDVRPFSFSVQMPGVPLGVQRLKRVYGKAVIYVNGGPVPAGSSVEVTLEKGAGTHTLVFPVTEDVFSTDDELFVRVGALDVDISDFQFGRTGFVAWFSLEESAVPAGVDAVKDQVAGAWGPQVLYSTDFATHAHLDGACFYQPSPVVFANVEALATLVPVSGCYSTVCGPVGLYCYTIDDPLAPELPVVQLLANQPNALESDGTVGYFTFYRSGPTTGSLVVNYSIGGTATPGVDYTAFSGTVTIFPGQSSATIALEPIDDADIESIETVVLTVLPSLDYTVGPTNTATGYVFSEDTLPIVWVEATDTGAGEDGGTGEFTFHRTGPTTGTLTVNYVVGGTASSGVDYTSIGTSVLFGVGVDAVTKAVTPIDDGDVEDVETVVVTLSASVDYALGAPSEATVFIADDDVAATAQLQVQLAGGEDVDARWDDVLLTNTTAYVLTAHSAECVSLNLDYTFLDGSDGDNDPFDSPDPVYGNMLLDAVQYGKATVFPGLGLDGVTSPTWVYNNNVGVHVIPHTGWPNCENVIIAGYGWEPTVWGFDKSENPNLVPGRYSPSQKSSTGTVTVPGTLGVDYLAEIRVRGVVSLSRYTGGSASGYLQTGGAPANTKQLFAKVSTSVSTPVYYLNRATAESLCNVGLDYTITIPVVGGETLTLELNNRTGFQYRAGADGNPVTVAGFDPSENIWIRLDVTDLTAV